MKKLFSILSVAFFAMVFIVLNTVQASAADPTTYYVKYDSSNKTWYYQVGSSWDNTAPPPNREVYYMLQEIKDGDYVVVESTGHYPTLEIDCNLGNLTVMAGSNALITCKSVKECYILGNSQVSLTADVEHAWVYDNVAVNFNKNVNYLEHIFSTDPSSSIAVVGSCYDFIVHNPNETRLHLWNFTEDLVYNDGAIKTPYGGYSINPPSGTPAPVTPSTPAAPSTPTAPPASADSEYDDVPKTGDALTFVWLFAAAAACMASGYSLKKRR